MKKLLIAALLPLSVNAQVFTDRQIPDDITLVNPSLTLESNPTTVVDRRIGFNTATRCIEIGNGASRDTYCVAIDSVSDGENRPITSNAVFDALAGKVDDAQVLTDVPAGAIFTDNQTITLSGDVSGTGTGAITTAIGAGAVGANELDDIVTAGSCTNCNLTVTDEGRISVLGNGSTGGSVDNLSNIPTDTIVGRQSAGTGSSENLTPAQVRSQLFDGETISAVGAVTTNTKFLVQDGDNSDVLRIATPSEIGGIEIEDESVSLTTDVQKINFAGAGVTVTEPIADEVLVTIPGGAGGTDISEPLVLVCTGQSNMIGRDNGGGDFGAYPGVQVWNSTNSAFEEWDLNANPTQVTNGDIGNNNLCFSFSKKLHESTGRVVKAIVEHQGSQAISQWIPDTQPRYAALDTKIGNSGVSRVHVILWHQGEGDNGSTQSAYTSDLTTLMNQFLAESYVDEYTMFIAGSLTVSTVDARNDVLNSAYFDAQSWPLRAKVADISDLPGVSGDEVHFTGPSLVTAGRERYWNKYQDLNHELTPTGFNQTIVSGNSADDQILLGSGSNAMSLVGLPDCDLTTQKLQYDQATNAFSCGTDQTGGGGGSTVSRYTRELLSTFNGDDVASDVTFTIPSGYDRIVIEGVVQLASTAATTNGVNVYFNGDTATTNYNRQRYDADGSSVSASTGNDSLLLSALTSNSANHDSGTIVSVVLDEYESSENKVIAGSYYSAERIGSRSVTWDNTAAITSLELEGFSSDIMTSATVLRVFGERVETIGGGTAQATAGAHLTKTGDSIAADVELSTRMEIIAIPDPVDTDSGDVQLMFPTAVTITRIACSTDVGTVTIQFDERNSITPNSSGTDVMTAPLVCDSNQEATSSFLNASIVDRVPMNLDIDAVASSPTKARIFVEYTIDD